MSPNESEISTLVRNARTEELMQGREFIDPTQITRFIFQSDRMTLDLVEDSGPFEHNAILVCLYSGNGDEEVLQHQWIMDLGQALASEFPSTSEERQDLAHLQIYNYPGGAIWAEVYDLVDMDITLKTSALVAWNLLTSLAAMGSDLYDLTDCKRKILISKLRDTIREHCEFADVKHEESNEVEGEEDFASGGEIPEGADEDEQKRKDNCLDLQHILSEVNDPAIKLMTLDVVRATDVIRHTAILVSLCSRPAADGEHKAEHQWTMDFSQKPERPANRFSGNSGGILGSFKNFVRGVVSKSPAHLRFHEYPGHRSWKVLQKVARLEIKDRDDCGVVKNLLSAIASSIPNSLQAA